MERTTGFKENSLSYRLLINNLILN